MATEPKENVTVSLSVNLVKVLDHHCCLTEQSRARAITFAIKQYLSTERSKDPAYWEAYYSDLEAKGKFEKI